MNLLSKNFIIFYLLVSVLGIFGFHWFSVDNMMPISDCFSISNCVFTASQTITPEVKSALLIALLAVFFIGFLSSMKLLSDNFKKMSSRMFLKWKIDWVLRELISWLKIIEGRDPRVAGCPLGLAARISDFRQ